MNFGNIKKMSKRKIIGYILLIIVAVLLWFISIPAIGVYIIVKKTKLTKGKKWLASIGFVIVYIIIFGTISETIANNPTITIYEPQSNFATDAKQTNIKGKIIPSNAELKINNQPLEKDATGNFSIEVSLPKNSNTFSITANADGKIATEVINIKRNLTAEEKIEQDKKAAETKKKQKAIEEAETKRLQQEADEAEAAVKKMVEKKDDIGKMILYYDKSFPQNNATNNISLYIAEPIDTHLGYLRLRIRYEGDNWLFIQKYTIKADDKIFEIIPDKVNRDNDSRVWEWSDFGPTDEQMNILVAVVNSKEAKIRCEGQTYYKDRVITSAEKTALKNVILAYKAMYK